MQSHARTTRLSRKRIIAKIKGKTNSEIEKEKQEIQVKIIKETYPETPGIVLHFKTCWEDLMVHLLGPASEGSFEAACFLDRAGASEASGSTSCTWPAGLSGKEGAGNA